MKASKTKSIPNIWWHYFDGYCDEEGIVY